MNLQQIQYFKVIAELEHYTRAAEKLLISQPSLSYAMSELERELGAPLFRKVGRGVTLTKYGKSFLQHAERSLRELEEGKEEIAQMLYPDRGTIVLSYASSMGFNFIPYIVSCFYEEESNRQIEFVFEQRPTPETVKLFRDGSIDIGFGSRTDNPEMIFSPIYKEKMVVVVPFHHPLAERKTVSLKEIAQENLVTWKKSCASRPEVEELFRKAKITPRIAYEVQDEVMITGIVAKGLGVGIVPRLLGRDYENVKMLEIEGLEASRTMYMIWPQNQFFSPASEKFRDFVIRHMEEFQEDTGKF